MDTKECIINRAAELFKNYGIRSVSLDDLCSSIRISKKTFYAYFVSKDMLVNDVADLYLVELGEELDRSNSCKEPIKASLLIWDALYLFYLRFSTGFLGDVEWTYPVVWKKYKALRHKIVSPRLVKNIENGMFNGYYREDIDKDSTTELWINLIDVTHSFQNIHGLVKDFFIRGLMTNDGIVNYDQRFKIK